MKTRMQAHHSSLFRSVALAPLALLLLASLILTPGCNQGSSVATVGPDAQRAQLQGVQLGRLVDIYAYQRIDPSIADRRIRLNRKLELVAENVVINPNLQSDSLFDAAGEEVPTATFELRPFDKNVGHEELVILWDNRDNSAEKARFDAAFEECQTGLTELAPAFRGQNTQLRPVPVVPRNAALRLQFSGAVNVTDDFFEFNPSAVQLLEFKGDPNVVQPVDAFRILPARVIPQGDRIVIDTTILGGEGQSGFTTSGLPESVDNATANIRLAIPARGSVVSTFFVGEDGNENLNGVDSAGRQSIIRDFRSGNLNDGAAGKLAESETPMIVGSLPMGIVSIDAANKIVRLNKRESLVPVRGRYPFVDGPLAANDVPVGPVNVPTVRALRAGDILTQELLVQLSTGALETVTVRAEVLENLMIGSRVGGALPIGLSAGGDQGESLTVVDVRVATLEGGRDSEGTLHSFLAPEDPLAAPDGRDCILRARYYEDVPFSTGGQVVSDANWRRQFLRIEPQPPAAGLPGAGKLVPQSSVAIEFTKPLDLDQIDNTENLLFTNTRIADETFDEQMSDPKRATARVVPSRLADIGGDGTVLRLQPQLGFFHRENTSEDYSFHVKLGAEGVLDLGGNQIEVFGDPINPLASWSVDLQVLESSLDNLVGWHTYLFRDSDEDGSLPGSVDLFGQFRLQDGRLIAAAGVRFSRTADSQNLGTISRVTRGECWDPDFDWETEGTGPTSPQGLPGLAPVDQQMNVHTGLLYWNPRMFDQIVPPAVPQVYEFFATVPQNVGRVIEPLNGRGSRMQMRYLEDDFSLDYHQATDMGIDVDQLYWSPFNDETVFYDVFDRMSMSLSHSDKRPDEVWRLVPGVPGDPTAMPPVPATLPTCDYLCTSNSSALSTVFADNVLEGTSQVPVFADKVYTINPNDAFRSAFNVTYVPFPRFDRSYTWRDSRLVTIDASGQVIGLGGAQTPGAEDPNDDWTAHISSPWITDAFPENAEVAGPSEWVMDPGDFKGNHRHDHDPIALPLLVDYKVFADSPANGLAVASNSFQLALLGPPSYGFAPWGGYYDGVPAGCGTRPAWPSVRVHASGGVTLTGGTEILVDPANTLDAAGPYNVLKDAGLGDPEFALFQAPPRDGMLNWAQADFVRKVSTMTFGFFDTLQPQRAEFVNDPGGTPTIEFSDGFPNLAGVSTGLRVTNLVTQLDPPAGRQPAGTTVVLELRGVEEIGDPGVDPGMYNPTFDGANQTPNDTFDGRGNLLNPNYACEAFRYSQATYAEGHNTGGGDLPRVATTGLTRYVTEGQLGQIRNPATGLLPRYLNARLTMTNNVDVTPALSPSLRSMAIVYRVVPQ